MVSILVANVMTGSGMVAVARPPDVFVRALSMAEGQRWQRINRTAKDPVRLRRGDDRACLRPGPAGA
jgi:hypothetical protein